MNQHINDIQLIPLASLTVSALNARTINRKPMDELAASIEAEGLLQNLTVTDAGDGKFEVVAGARRLAALNQLLRDGKLPANLLDNVPCLIVTNGRAAAASLAENVVREKMHPADEFVAFKRLVDGGASVVDIAHQFGIQPLAVRRHLKLANVAPELFELFREDKIALDQMYALAVSDDHAAQIAAWNQPHDYMRMAHHLRSTLLKTEVDIRRDPAARFVGVEALEAAGIVIRHDLFSADGGGGFTSERARIDELALTKLEAVALKVSAEGWARVGVHIEFNWEARKDYEIEYPAHQSKLSDADQDRLDTLIARIDEIEEIDVDELNDGEYENLEDEQEKARDEADALQASICRYSPEQLARCIAVVSLSDIGDGIEQIHRGLRLKKGAKPADPRTDSAKPKGKPPASTANLSESLTRRLTAHRTAIIQNAIATDPKLATIILAHKLMLPLFYSGRGQESVCTIAAPPRKALEQFADELPTARCVNALAEHLALQVHTLPPVTELFDWLLDQPTETIDALLASCVAVSIDTVTSADSNTAARMMVREVIAAAGIDLADHWHPTRKAFLNHVPAAVIKETVKQACGAAGLVGIETFNKGLLIVHAEQKLKDTRWLPKVLAIPGTGDKTKPKLKKPRDIDVVADAVASAPETATPKKPAAKKATPKSAKQKVTK